MTTSEDRFQRAFDSPLISEMSVVDLTVYVTRQVLECYVLAGFRNCNEADNSILTTKFTSDLRESYGFLHRDEIAVCFELGIKGEYGEYMGINLRTFTKWLKSYRRSDFRYRIVMQREAEKKAREQAALPPISKEYNDAAMRRMIADCYASYKKNPEKDLVLPSIIYQGLHELGYINHTPEQKKYAISLFARWKPRGNLSISSTDRDAMIALRAQEWLVKQYFGSISTLPFQAGS